MTQQQTPEGKRQRPELPEVRFDDIAAAVHHKNALDLYGKPFVETDTPAMREVRQFLDQAIAKRFPEAVAHSVRFFTPKQGERLPASMEAFIYVPAGGLHEESESLKSFQKDLEQLQIVHNGVVYPGPSGAIYKKPDFLSIGKIVDMDRFYMMLELTPERMCSNLQQSQKGPGLAKSV